MAYQEGQSRCRKIPIEARKRRLRIVPWKHGPLIPGVCSTYSVQPHGKTQHMLYDVQLQFLLFLLVDDVAKTISLFVAYLAA